MGNVKAFIGRTGCLILTKLSAVYTLLVPPHVIIDRPPGQLTCSGAHLGRGGNEVGAWSLPPVVATIALSANWESDCGGVDDGDFHFSEEELPGPFYGFARKHAPSALSQIAPIHLPHFFLGFFSEFAPCSLSILGFPVPTTK
jgi:hypothetical protein